MDAQERTVAAPVHGLSFCWYGDVGNAMPVRQGPAPNRVVDDGIVVEEAERGNDSPVGK